MATRYTHLFRQANIGSVKLKNRIAMAPMSNAGLVNLDGSFNKRGEEYFVERAKGGVGLIITGFTEIEDVVEKKMPGTAQNTFANPYGFMVAASEITERVHAYNCKIFLQLTMGFGRVGFYPYIVERPVAPSAVPNFWHPEVTCRELKTEEIESIVKSAGEAAKLAKDSGFDGVEIHAMHEGYLLDQFAMTMFNKRNDKYGGDLSGRLRFALEVLDCIKTAAGRDYPVVLRFGVKSFIKDWGRGALPGETFREMGRDLEEALVIARILEDAGYDALDADCGSYEGWYWAHPPGYHEHGCYLPYVKELKKAVSIPILTSGRMELPDLAENAIRDNLVDIVMIGRGLLAEPNWAKKVFSGHADDLRPCLGCHDGCITREDTNKALSCAVNPACGREAVYGLARTDEEKRIAIVGGGVAGMEAARVAALRGHAVELFEARSELGGHVIEGSAPDFKEDEKRLMRWYRKQLRDLGVCVHCNTFMDRESVLALQADAVVIATGSEARKPNLAGTELPNVVNAGRLLLDGCAGKENIAVVGGGLVGCEVALWLARQNKRVTLVEMLDQLMGNGPAICPANKRMLTDFLAFNAVRTMTGASLLEIFPDGLSVFHAGKVQRLEADLVVLSVGYKERSELYESLLGEINELYLIGDANKVRNIMGAIWDGYEIGRIL